MAMDLSGFKERAEKIGVLGLKVTQNGEDIAVWKREDEWRRNVYSAAKSFTSCAVGLRS